MTKKYKILGKYIKDRSGKKLDTKTNLYLADGISKYKFNINLSSNLLKKISFFLFTLFITNFKCFIVGLICICLLKVFEQQQRKNLLVANPKL